MPERQIAFASTWFYREGQHITAHRGEFVEIPDNEIERLDAVGALVPEGGELARPGTLLLLDASASQEHVANYVASGNVDEILEHAADYPTALVERILIAERAGQARERLVSGLDARVRGLNELVEPVTVPDVLRPLTVEDGAELVEPIDGVDVELVEFVSTNTVEAVLEHAGDDPAVAAALRVAEESRGDKARKGVIEGLAKIENPEG